MIDVAEFGGRSIQLHGPGTREWGAPQAGARLATSHMCNDQRENVIFHPFVAFIGAVVDKDTHTPNIVAIIPRFSELQRRESMNGLKLCGFTT